MSYTEMVCFKKDGNAEYYEDIKNAFRGAMAIWTIMEEKYLPMYRPSFVPEHVKDEDIEQTLGYKPTRTCCMFDKDAMKEIWNLFNSDKVSKTDKIVLGTTFDRVLVKRENFKDLIEAFNSFEGETSLKEQAEAIEEMLRDDDIIAAGWNQTSVCENQWVQHKPNQEEDGYEPYNCLSETEHFWLFDDLT